MGSKVNYKPLFSDKVKEFTNKCPDHSLGEFLYSFMRQLSKSGTPINNKSNALNLTDKELYAAICKTVKEESGEDEPIN
jgi:hypothetical protein